ncbi:MAG: type II toxin-antitoxin system VapC family toxin [Cytophagales bacterium]|nr:type II toxin-antitoxin system VapC family toxin [Cytophagales bacterium]
MNGDDYLLDTNAVLYLLVSDEVVNFLAEKTISISVITELELLSYHLPV